MSTAGNPTLWAVFAVLVVTLVAADLGLLSKSTSEISLREAFYRSVGWISVAALFNAGVYFMLGREDGLEFTAAYLLEQALSVDNLFVFVVIFSAFRVGPKLQHRVLFWGIIGAVVLRGIFIGVGTALVQNFHWVMYVFGGILIWTAWKLLSGGEDGEEEPANNSAFRLFKRIVPAVPDFRGKHFLVREGGKLMATPLLAVLVLVETSDVLFAMDSIPAVFGVSDDVFIIYTSNIFAILGLRSMYFLLSGVVHKFAYLKTGLAAILAFIGAKMILHELHALEIPTGISLGVIAGLLGITILVSMLWPPKEGNES